MTGPAPTGEAVAAYLVAVRSILACHQPGPATDLLIRQETVLHGLAVAREAALYLEVDLSLNPPA